MVGAEPSPERVGVGYQHARQIERIERVVMLERALLAVRLALIVADDRARIASQREFVQMRPHRAEHRMEVRHFGACEVADRRDSRLMHPLERHSADAP